VMWYDVGNWLYDDEIMGFLASCDCRFLAPLTCVSAGLFIVKGLVFRVC
jgi:hypothetical protein